MEKQILSILLSNLVVSQFLDRLKAVARTVLGLAFSDTEIAQYPDPLIPSNVQEIRRLYHVCVITNCIFILMCFMFFMTGQEMANVMNSTLAETCQQSVHQKAILVRFAAIQQLKAIPVFLMQYTIGAIQQIKITLFWNPKLKLNVEMIKLGTVTRSHQVPRHHRLSIVFV